MSRKERPSQGEKSPKTPNQSTRRNTDTSPSLTSEADFLKWLPEAVDQELRRHSTVMHILTHAREFEEMIVSAQKAYEAGDILTLEEFKARMNHVDAAEQLPPTKPSQE